MKPWQTKATVAFFAFAVGFIAAFQIFASQPPDRISYDLGYAEGFDEGQVYGAKHGYPDEGLLPVLPALGVLVGAVGLVGLIIAALRFKYGKMKPWDSCRPACIGYEVGHDPRCPLGKGGA
jgi:hypothetical protein